MKRIDKLTPEQEAQMAPHAAKWIAIGQQTGEADWDRFTDGARRCYGYAGLDWHNNVVRVADPLILSLAAPIAASLIQRAERQLGAVAVGGAVGVAVGGAVGGAVDVAVGGAVDVAVRVAVDVAVRVAVGDAVRGAVDGAVGGAVRVAVDGAVDGAVGDAVDGARNAILNQWYYRLGGQWWVSWQAWTSFFREVCGLDLPGDLWDRDKAYADAQSSAGWWWPHRRFTMVCDRPRVLHLEQVGPAGWGSHRLHCADGPAIAWSSGWGLHYWHGTRVPADLIEGDGWSTERILREENQEVRRCAIERIGWDVFIDRAGLRPVGASVPDPGNEGNNLCLYDVPEQIYDEPVRVLLCTNGSPERDGTRRRFGLTVPAEISDPIVAAAWTYDWPVAAYRQLARRA